MEMQTQSSLELLGPSVSARGRLWSRQCCWQQKERICLDSANHSLWQAGCWQPGTDGWRSLPPSLSQLAGILWIHLVLAHFYGLCSHQARAAGVFLCSDTKLAAQISMLPCWGLSNLVSWCYQKFGETSGQHPSPAVWMAFTWRGWQEK